MRPLILILILLAVAGCEQRPEMSKVAGQWPGEFTAEGDAAGTYRLKGYLQLYLTGEKFKMEMSSRDQGFTVTGKWTIKGGSVRIVGDGFTFDNPTEEDQKVFRMKLISPDQIRTTFSHGLVFKASEDRKTLTGLKTSFGSILGSFNFDRPLPQ